MGALKEKLMHLDQEARTLETQLDDCSKVIGNNKVKTQALIEENVKKELINQQLASDIRKIKIENARLSSFKSYIFNTFDIPTENPHKDNVVQKERVSPKMEVYNIPAVVAQPYK
jgi:regulator of replication initiation timing